MHQSAFMSAHWTSRRKASAHPVAPVRRPCTTDAQWNVQVVKGKVTTRCLWNACKALTIGLSLMMIGCTMAVIGYYADQLSVNHEVRGNSTVRVKNESRGFHLNNLSYAGPIVMGVGGFIVVAACVMTFEARDNAAKVVPARLKYNPSAKTSPGSQKQHHHHHHHSSQRSDSGRRNQTCQTGKWDNHMGLFRSNNHSNGHVDGASPCGSESVNRRALTAAFVQFSRALQDQHIANEARFGASVMKRSPSAPNLMAEVKLQPLALTQIARPAASPGKRSKQSSNVLLHPTGGGCAFLSPYVLQRQALSMDNPAYDGCPYYSPPSLSRQRSHQSGGSRESMELGASAGVSGSQASMAMDLHLPNDCPVTLKVKDQSRRSDTAKKHMFVRQRPVEDELEAMRGGSPDYRRGEAHSCSPRMSSYYSRSNTEDSRGSNCSGSRSNVDSRYRYRQDSIASGIEKKMRRSDSRYRKRTSYAHPIAMSRSNDEETRMRRQSITISDQYKRRRSSNQTINHYSRANTDDSRHHHSDGSPYSISRANTEDETRNSNEFELCYLKTDHSSTCTIESETKLVKSDPSTETTVVKVETLEKDKSKGAKPKKDIGPDEVIEVNG